MKRLWALWSLVVALATPATAAARPPCGPEGAKTLARSDHARVYAAGDRIVGCHRAAERPRGLADREAVLQVKVRGRYAAVRRRAEGEYGERLTINDLRRGTRIAGRRLRGGGRFTRLILDPTGIAAFLAAVPTKTGSPVVAVATTDVDAIGNLDRGPDISPRVLGLAGSTIAWRRAGDIRLTKFEESTTRAGVLLRLGSLRIDATDDNLVVRKGDGPPVELQAAEDVCVSSSGCAGTSTLRRAGGFLAAVTDVCCDDLAEGHLRIVDLAAGTSRLAYDGDVGTFVLLESGAAAFVVSEPLDRFDFDSPDVLRIRAERTLLDEGNGIDGTSLRRRGDRLVWRHDGAKRSAPLPEPPPPR